MKQLLTLCGVLALSLALAGCDACGNWPWSFSDHGVQACRGGPPAR